MASEIKIKEIIIGMIIFSALITGIATFSGNIFENYGVTGTDNLTYMDKAAEISAEVESYEQSITDAQITNTAADLPLVIITGTFNTLKLMLNIPDLMTSVITDIGLAIGLPGWFTSMIIAIIIIIVIFAVVTVLLKGGSI